MKHTLVFNGNPLPSKVGITSLTVSTPDTEFETLEVSGRRGVLKYGRKMGNRAIQINMVLLGSSISENNKIIRNLYSWCYSNEPKPMIIPGMTKSYINVECETYPPVDIAQFGAEFTMNFKAHIPDFIEIAESSANVGNTAFTVGGMLPVYPVIEQYVTQDITNPLWRIDGTKFLKISTTIHPGSTIKIDCARDIVYIDGNNANAYIGINSTIGFTLEPGEHKIKGESGAGGVVKWHNASLWGA